MTYTHKIVDGKRVDLTADEITALEAQDAAWVAGQPERDRAAFNAPILNQLAQLDIYLPRAVEDFWSSSGFDTTKLPSVQQQRLSLKLSLRSQIQK